MNKVSVLVVDDNELFAKSAVEMLQNEGWEAFLITKGEDALKFLEKHIPNVLVLDIKLPGMSGIDLLQHIISHDSTSAIRIIMVSGYGNEEERLKCLDMGAADYLSKPFRIRELIYHIRLVLGSNDTKNTASWKQFYSDGELKIDFAGRAITVKNKAIHLTPIEYSLLQELVLNAGKVLDHQHLLHRVWNLQYGNENYLLHVHINHLRAKIELDPKDPRYIISIPGVGYRFQPPNN